MFVTLFKVVENNATAKYVSIIKAKGGPNEILVCNFFLDRQCNKNARPKIWVLNVE